MSAGRWTDEQVASFLWLASALREKRDPVSEQFWEAVQCFGYTEHPIESRRLRRATARALEREYPGGVRGWFNVLTIEQAAARIQVKPETMKRWLRKQLDGLGKEG
jgi:hypothetical protein